MANMQLKMQPGAQSNEEVDLYGKLTSLEENTLTAVKYHLCNGATIKLASAVFDLKEPNLIRAVNKINEVNETVQQIIDFRLKLK
ncbi:MAG TPA: hypothetical protein VIC51_01415 [Psychromonas sp.]